MPTRYRLVPVVRHSENHTGLARDRICQVDGEEALEQQIEKLNDEISDLARVDIYERVERVEAEDTT